MKLSDKQIANAREIRDELNNVGIDNKLLQVAVVAVCYKESDLVPRRENLNYSKERLLQCWPKMPVTDADRLANNPKALGDYLYGGKYGNLPTEGWYWRGGGHNQITFKNIYFEFGVANPDDILNPKVAAMVSAKFFKKVLNQGVKLGSFAKFGIHTLAEINSQRDAVKLCIQANAGLGTTWEDEITPELKARLIESRTLKDASGKVTKIGELKKNVIVQEGFIKSFGASEYINSIL